MPVVFLNFEINALLKMAKELHILSHLTTVACCYLVALRVIFTDSVTKLDRTLQSKLHRDSHRDDLFVSINAEFYTRINYIEFSDAVFYKTELKSMLITT